MTMCTHVGVHGYIWICVYVDMYILIWIVGVYSDRKSMQAFEKLWGGNAVKCVCVCVRMCDICLLSAWEWCVCVCVCV